MYSSLMLTPPCRWPLTYRGGAFDGVDWVDGDNDLEGGTEIRLVAATRHSGDMRATLPSGAGQRRVALDADPNYRAFARSVARLAS